MAATRTIDKDGRIYKKQGVWVFDSGEPLDAEVVNRTIRQGREERERHNPVKTR